MRNAWRVLAFDVAAPLAAIAALLAIGVVLAWPAWWVSLCSVLVLLIVEGVAVNVFLLRRDSVTVGTDDDAPALRLAVVALCTAALVAAVLTGYRHWTTPDHDLKVDTAEVVRVATSMAEATATFSPQEPMAAIDRAVTMMVPEQGSPPGRWRPSALAARTSPLPRPCWWRCAPPRRCRPSGRGPASSSAGSR